jgi:hypothetical protein
MRSATGVQYIDARWDMSRIDKVRTGNVPFFSVYGYRFIVIGIHHPGLFAEIHTSESGFLQQQPALTPVMPPPLYHMTPVYWNFAKTGPTSTGRKGNNFHNGKSLQPKLAMA